MMMRAASSLTRDHKTHAKKTLGWDRARVQWTTAMRGDLLEPANVLVDAVCQQGLRYLHDWAPAYQGQIQTTKRHG